MTVSTIAGPAAGAIALLGFVPYLRSAVNGTTRPNRASWWIWTVVGGLLCASYRTLGAREAIWVSISYVVGPLLTALVSVRYGEGGWGRLERACLAGAGVTLGLWWISGSPALALFLNVLLDACGAVPTVVKTWRDPASEDLLSWSLFLTGNTLNLLAVPAWTLTGAAYPLYLFAVAATVVGLSLRGRRRVEAPSEE